MVNLASVTGRIAEMASVKWTASCPQLTWPEVSHQFLLARTTLARFCSTARSSAGDKTTWVSLALVTSSRVAQSKVQWVPRFHLSNWAQIELPNQFRLGMSTPALCWTMDL
jgi:hypothetical protein